MVVSRPKEISTTKLHLCGRDQHLIVPLSVCLGVVQPLPLRGFDEECRKFIAEQYEVQGLNIHSESTPTRIEKQSNGSFTLHVKKKSGEEEAIEGLETVLMATGRSPNTQNMNLEKVRSLTMQSWVQVK